MQPTKCVVFQGLDHFISFPLGFLNLNSGFRIFGAKMKFTSFVESFMVEAFHEDFKMISKLFMLAND